MASFTLKGGATFPEGTGVGAYPRTAWPSWQPPSGAPSGSAAAGPVTVTNNEVTFTGLVEGTEYVAYAGTPDRFKRFLVPLSSAVTAAGTFRGAWQANTGYKAGQLVTQNGVIYSANADFTSSGSFDVANWSSVANVGPQIKVLTADMAAITASTTLLPITGLGVDIGASATEIWLLKYWLLVQADNQTMDVKFGMNSNPAGTNVRWGGIVGDGGGPPAGWGAPTLATAVTALALNSTISIGTNNGPTATGVALVAVVFGGGTAGTVQIRVAQNTSDAGALQILKGSLVEATKVAA